KLWCGRQRVQPAQSLKASEVPVGRAQRETMLDCHRGEVRIGHQIAENAGLSQEFVQHLSMARGRLRYPNRITVEPRRYLLPGDGHCEWARKCPRIRRGPKKGKQCRPRQPNRAQACELSVQPRPSASMQSRGLVTRVQQNVGIDEDHLNPSPSV